MIIYETKISFKSEEGEELLHVYISIYIFESCGGVRVCIFYISQCNIYLFWKVDENYLLFHASMYNTSRYNCNKSNTCMHACTSFHTTVADHHHALLLGKKTKERRNITNNK